MKLNAQDAQKLLSESLGVDAIHVVVARRGVATFTFSLPENGEKRLVKIACETPDEVEANQDSIAREVAFYAQDSVISESLDPKSLAQKGIPGISLLCVEGTRAFADTVSKTTASIAETFVEAVKVLDDVHSMGWTHGDIQPAHFLRLPDESIVLLDYGVAHNPIFPNFNYGGGMVHFNAPEICATVNEGGLALPTVKSDIFGLAASYSFSLTGKIIGGYDPKLTTYDEMLKTIAAGNLDFAALNEKLVESPRLLEVLTNMLSPDPRNRPSSTAICSQLREVRDLSSRVKTNVEDANLKQEPESGISYQ